MSDAFEVVLKVKDNCKEFCDKLDDFFTVREDDTMRRAFENRFSVSIDAIHFAADILDPRFQGMHLTSNQRIQGYEYIKKISNHLNRDNDKYDVNVILENLGEFCDRAGPYAPEILWEAAHSHKLATWWRVLCGSEPLAPIASKLLQLPCSNTCSERNWAQRGDVHTAKKNRFKPEKVRQLVTC